MKKLSILCILSFVFCVGATFAYTSEDLSNANSLADQQIIMKQTIASKYGLDNKILRQEAIGIALKVKGVTLPENYKCKKYFADATKNDWICRAVELAADNGIISKSNRYANPGKYVTRAEAFIMLYNASGLTPLPDSGGGPVKYADLTITWQKNLFQNILASGIGYTQIPGARYDSTSENPNIYYFYPNRLATRAEVFGFAKNITSTEKGNTLSVCGNGTIENGEKCDDGNMNNNDYCNNMCQNKFSSICTSFTYSDWGACINGLQTRDYLNAKPAGCVAGNPIVSQSCTDGAAVQCTNSDGKDYYTKGSAQDQDTIKNIPGGVMYDSCAIGGDNGSNMQYQYIQSCVSRNCYVHEFYCSEYGNVSVEPYRCPNGCTDGACNKNPVGSCTNLLVAELNSFNRTVPIKCEGDDVKYSDIVVEYPDGTLFDTFPGLNVTVTLPNSPKGNYIVKCYVNGQTTTTSSCQKIITN